jgi:serine/threonine-protein kinase
MDRTDLAPGACIGEYRIERKLAEGGMSTVYAALHPLIEKRVAIKVVHPLLSLDATGMVRMVQEARIINQIGHPNIVDVYSFGRLPDGRCYLVMEWLEGETLCERLRRGRLPLEEAIAILLPICDALEATHDKGIIHRDVKPANVLLVGAPERVKLLDFGVAKLLGSEPASGLTLDGCVVGTPEYIAPEQARGKPVDARVDVYSLGVMAFEMILGELPFSGETPMDTMQQHLHDPVPAATSLWPAAPAALDELLWAMMAKDARLRPSIGEVRRRLVELRDEARASVDESPSSQRWLSVLGMAAATLTLVGLIAALGPSGAAPPRVATVAAEAPHPTAEAEAKATEPRAAPPAAPRWARTPPLTAHAHAPPPRAKPTQAARANGPRVRVTRPRPVKLPAPADYLLDPFRP